MKFFVLLAFVVFIETAFAVPILVPQGDELGSAISTIASLVGSIIIDVAGLLGDTEDKALDDADGKELGRANGDAQDEGLPIDLINPIVV